jgi:hypothetical protein
VRYLLEDRHDIGHLHVTELNYDVIQAALVVFRLSWKWRERSPVKITENA